MTRGCDDLLPFPALVSYWFGELPAADADRVEEHLFACDRCGDRARAFVALGDGVRRLAHRGAVHVVVTPSFLEAASRAGLTTREYAVPPGGRVACTVTPRDDLLVGRMQADFRGVSRLDLVLQAAGQQALRLEDVPFSPDARELILLESMPAARAMGRVEIHVRLLAREGSHERVLGDYTFDHTPTPS